MINVFILKKYCKILTIKNFLINLEPPDPNKINTSLQVFNFEILDNLISKNQKLRDTYTVHVHVFMGKSGHA